ncbi:conserved hypothetical protein [methanotrophic bacterial endosymbiont of Bathymodiolus sp.]|nr:conserved hypothetical protein [methanotrophic bacterial endosymbiont of Bathymodiolus sp.]
MSSPRPWGCFDAKSFLSTKETVFPTPVGVFLVFRPPRPILSRLPHARGGVSYIRTSHLPTAVSSPRPWGCFYLKDTCVC